MYPQFIHFELFNETFPRRFLRRVGFDNPDKCWEWLGAVHNKGYGQTSDNGTSFYAHRAAWMLAYGEIPEGLHVCHHCDNPRCVNPNHLFIGTNTDNMRDKMKKGRYSNGKGRYAKATVQRNTLRKLSVEAVREIRTRQKTIREYAKQFGINHATISRIQNRKAYTDVP